MMALPARLAPMKLNEAQQAALGHIRRYASSRTVAARSLIDHVLRMSDVSWAEFEQALVAIRKHARVGLHFHPDRLNPDMVPVAESLLSDGFYKNQFETYLSSGRLSPVAGGDRDLWENELFGGAYRGAPPAERPKYGALNLMRLPDRPCPRFGSCYFLLRPQVLSRCTFTYMDSHTNPPEKGTLDAFDDVIAALLAESFQRDFALGKANVRPGALLDHLQRRLGEPFADPASLPPARNLDHYVEAQIHGPIYLGDDADILVADPAFQGSETGAVLARVCRRYDVDLYWHRGFQLKVEEVPTNFRGAAMPSLARRVAPAGLLDARLIGIAAADLKKHPEHWRDRGTPGQVLQELKLLWHVLVRFGT